jgi:hypothetical protein
MRSLGCPGTAPAGVVAVSLLYGVRRCRRGCTYRLDTSDTRHVCPLPLAAGRASGSMLLHSRGARMDLHPAILRIHHLAADAGVGYIRWQL